MAWDGDYSCLSTPLAHPGEHLRLDYLPEYKLDAQALTRALGLSDDTVVRKLLREELSISLDLASKLGRVFGTSTEFWLNLQASHDQSVVALKHRP
ncbi:MULTISPECIES: HigA family addiction module antitoxin [unclassified Brevundimonas]|uniref:HigA family addiction module antitoxin n=1 Tax=unclassified Brevundimonas TaxID=2622653 RepID=UPI0039184614